jgi:Fe-S-cluster containining protein
MSLIFASIVQTHSQRPEVRQSVTDIYGDLACAIEARQPICALSGRCCRFEEFGHRLYITTMELAAFAWEQRQGNRAPTHAWDGSGCPFQRGKLCSVHAIRPFGCRIFFCDPSATQWQQDQYELFHRRFQREHERLAVPYHYLEWREALKAVGFDKALSD